MEIICNDNEITLKPLGRIDTASAPTVEKEMFDALAGKEVKKLTVDLEKVTFVSSAGLRVFLKLKRAYDEMSIINVSPDVYDVFEMTGFTELIDIHKAYRNFSIDGCEIIGEGAVGVVYRVSDDTIVKVYKGDCPLEDIKHEIDISKKAFVLGVPTAISYDVVKVGDRFGTVYELLNCDTLKGLIKKHPEKLEEYSKLYVGMLKKLHACTIEDESIPSMKKEFVEECHVIAHLFPKELGDKLIRLANEIPDVRNILHADCHIKNVMVQNGEPGFEFGCIYNTYIGFTKIFHQEDNMFIGIPFDETIRFFRMNIRDYYDLDTEAEIDHYMNIFSVLGLTYLFEHIVNRPGFREDVGDRYDWIYNTFVKALTELDSLAA